MYLYSKLVVKTEYYKLGIFFTFFFKLKKDFLLLDEKSTEEIISRPKLEDCKIDCQNVTVKWPAAAETEDNTLTDVSFSVSPGQVLAVVGQVGSGKVILVFLFQI